MPQLQGIEIITEVLNDFLAEFELTATPSADFYYAWEDNQIGYALAVSEFADTCYQNYVRELCPQLKCDTFLLSFLHEVGHHHTIDDFSDEEYKIQQMEKNYINLRLKSPTLTEQRKIELYNEYFELAIEKVATVWAINFIISNEDKVRKFWEKAVAAITYFYEINDIEM